MDDWHWEQFIESLPKSPYRYPVEFWDGLKVFLVDQGRLEQACTKCGGTSELNADCKTFPDKCGWCKEGLELTDLGEYLVEFLKRHLKIGANLQ